MSSNGQIKDSGQNGAQDNPSELEISDRLEKDSVRSVHNYISSSVLDFSITTGGLQFNFENQK